MYLEFGGDMLILKLEQDLTKDDVEISIKYGIMSKDIERLVSLIQSVDIRIKCDCNDTEKLVNASDIYYIESVDKKTFLYCEKEVYRTEFRLYELMDMLTGMRFVQISKSCILNINTLDSIKSLFNSRLEVTLKNGERLYVNRKYIASIKQELEKG